MQGQLNLSLPTSVHLNQTLKNYFVTFCFMKLYEISLNCELDEGTLWALNHFKLTFFLI